MDLSRELLPVKFFVCHDNPVSKPLYDYITGGIEITEDMFFDDMFMFVISSVILFPMEPSKRKYKKTCIQKRSAKIKMTEIKVSKAKGKKSILDSLLFIPF
jgi:hypothetical protein